MDQAQVVPATLPTDFDLEDLGIGSELAGLDLFPGDEGTIKLDTAAAPAAMGEVFFPMDTPDAGSGAAAATARVARALGESKVTSPPPGTKLPLYTGPLPDSYHDLTDDQIGTIAYKDFVRLMTTSRLNQREVAEAKKRRRRVKNRLSARVCAKRQHEQTQESQSVNGALMSQITTLSHSCDFYQAQTLQLQERVIQLQKSEAEAVRQKLFFEAEVQRLTKLLQMVTTSSGGTAGPTVAATPAPLAAGPSGDGSPDTAATAVPAAAAAAAGSVMGADEFIFDFTAGDFACAA